MVAIKCTKCKEWFRAEEMGSISLEDKEALCNGCIERRKIEV